MNDYQISGMKEFTDTIPENSLMRVVAVPHPLKVERYNYYVPSGMSIGQILERVQPDKILRMYSNVFLDGELITQDRYNILPEHGQSLEIRVVPQGSRGGGKNPLKSLLTIAVIAASFYFAPGLAAFGQGLFGGVFTTTGAALFTGIARGLIGGLGMLASNALIPPARPSRAGLPSLSNSANTSSPTLFIEGARNNIRPFGVVPVVLGVHKNIPPLGATTYTELLGEDQYLRMVAIWGYGALKIEDIKIGETPVENFEGVTIETMEGRTGDPPITVYPRQVTPDDTSVVLLQAEGWQQRTTATSTDEIIIDIIFPRGLVAFGEKTGQDFHSVAIEVNYRLAGDVTWLNPPFKRTNIPDSWVSGGTITFTHAKSSAFRVGLRWDTPARGQYEIQVRRLTEDYTSTRIIDDVAWAGVKSYLNEDLIEFPEPLAKTALVIKATNQLQGVIDTLNATVSSYCLDWNGSTWTEAVTSNPASLFRHVLQSPANKSAVADSRIDLDMLQTWHEFCAANGFEFNMIRDFVSSVWETLSDIALAGRASPTQIDGKWSVVIDQYQTLPVQHYTPKNSWGFQAEKSFVDIPHGFRMRFANREKDWKNDEIIVYDDGYSASNATDFEQLDAVGMTDPDHVWKFGRYNLAQIRLLPEKWSFNTDFEYIVGRRGDLVLVTHDVLEVGLSSGRIKVVTTSGGDATGVTVDEICTMESGKSYGVSIRSVGNVELTAGITLNVGDQTVLVFTTPIPAANIPAVGDLFGFGELGSETIEGTILTIEPASEFTARLEVVPHSQGIYTADTGTIPPFSSKITTTGTLPNVQVTRIRTDETALRLGAGNTLIPQIAMNFIPLPNQFDARIYAEIRQGGATAELPWEPAKIYSQTFSEFIIEGVQHLKTYSVRAKFILNDPDRLNYTSPQWQQHNNIYVIGTSTPPAALENLTISVFGGTALLRWDAPPELDVKFGGRVEFRHSHELLAANATWAKSVGIGQTSKSDDLMAQLPLKAGTYLARVFDNGGRSSDVSKIDTKQASINSFSNVGNVTEESTFSGTHTNTEVNSGKLELSDATASSIEPTGTYDFAAGFDLTTVKKVRLTTDIEVEVLDVFTLISQRTTIMSTWPSFSGADAGAGDARVQERHTDDDPAGSPTWTSWNNLESAEFTARGFDFRIILTSNDPVYNIRVSKLQVNAEELA